MEHDYKAAKRARIQRAFTDRGPPIVHHVDVDDWFQNGMLYLVPNVTRQLHARETAPAAGSSILQDAAGGPRRQHPSAGRLLLVVAAGAAMLLCCALRRRWRHRSIWLVPDSSHVACESPSCCPE